MLSTNVLSLLEILRNIPCLNVVFVMPWDVNASAPSTFYFPYSTSTSPAQIFAINVTDPNAPLAIWPINQIFGSTSTLILPSAVTSISCGAIDTVHNYAYFGTGQSPATVVQVKLDLWIHNSCPLTYPQTECDIEGYTYYYKYFSLTDGVFQNQITFAIVTSNGLTGYFGYVYVYCLLCCVLYEF